MRIPVIGGTPIESDRLQTPLSEVSVATPCGITTWGEGPRSWSSSMAVLLIAAGLPDDRPALPDGFDTDALEATFAEHPAEVCGALHCRRGVRPI